MGRFWTWIVAALSSGASSKVEAITTRQTLRVIGREIRDAEERATDSRSILADLLGKSASAAADVARNEKRLDALAADAEMALATGREDLALETAGQIEKLQSLLAHDARLCERYSTAVHTLREALRANEEKLEELKSGLATVRSAAQTQQALMGLTSTSAARTDGMEAAAISLRSIHQRQLETIACLQAREEVMSADGSLEARLREAGIFSDAHGAYQVPGRISSHARQS